MKSCLPNGPIQGQRLLTHALWAQLPVSRVPVTCHQYAPGWPHVTVLLERVLLARTPELELLTVPI